MKDDEHTQVYEIEVATIEEFLRLLDERETSAASRDSGEGVRRGVFVARISGERTSRFGFPSVRRYVVASFVYGRDLISYKVTTSSIVELPELVRGMEERQRSAYEQVRSEIETGLQKMSSAVPVHEGCLIPPNLSRNDS